MKDPTTIDWTDERLQPLVWLATEIRDALTDPPAARGAAVDAFAARWGITLALTPDRSGGFYDDEAAGTNYRVALTVLDPATRLHRTATAWHFQCEDPEDGAPPAEILGPAPGSEPFRDVLGGIWTDCDELSHDRDLFDFCLGHHMGTANDPETAREQYQRSVFHQAEMQRLFGPAGYQEFLALRPYRSHADRTDKPA